MSLPLSRRDVLLGATLVAASGEPVSAATTGGRRALPDELLDLSAAEAVGRMARGDLSVERYAKALLEQCARHAALNAFISLDAAQVLERARALDLERARGGTPGPLFGLPIPVKDSVNSRDYPTTAGTPALRHFRPAEDAPTLKRLRDAGAIVLGKTNLHELSFGWTSNNHAFGAVHNPFDPTRIPGGSSGGTAAAVAARMAPLGVAEDTQGSIRVPAACCGIAGFRPTTGRYPTTGCAPISSLFDQIGPHARCVPDLALFDAVAAQDARALPARPVRGARLAVVREHFFSDLDPEVARITQEVMRKLEDAGAVLVEADMPGLKPLLARTTDQVQYHDARPALMSYLQDYGSGVSFEQLLAQASGDIRETFAGYVLPGAPHAVSDAEYAAARDEHLPALRKLYRDFFTQHRVDALVFPTLMVPPPRIGEETTVDIGGRTIPFEIAIARNISPGSTAGIPGLVLPAGLTQGGLPLSIELDGPAGADRALLALGASIEAVLGRIPPPV